MEEFDWTTDLMPGDLIKVNKKNNYPWMRFWQNEILEVTMIEQLGCECRLWVKNIPNSGIMGASRNGYNSVYFEITKNGCCNDDRNIQLFELVNLAEDE